jgi:hypothetical protein
MRLYVAQYCDSRRGWVDMPQTANKKQKEAERAAFEVANKFFVATRTIQKPNGWEPPDGEVLPIGRSFRLSDQVKDSRRNKNG